MRQSILAFLCMVLFSAAATTRGQVVPSATGDEFRLNAGGMGSMFQPDYENTGVAAASPNRLYGISAYVDAHLTRWVQIEGEARWLRFNESYVCSIAAGKNVYCQNGENSYMIGPRVAPYTFHKFTPYGKFLVGFGNGTFLSGSTFTMAYGGGVDYRLTPRFTLRCIDFQYQQWFVTPRLYPYGGSVGVSYTIF